MSSADRIARRQRAAIDGGVADGAVAAERAAGVDGGQRRRCDRAIHAERAGVDVGGAGVGVEAGQRQRAAAVLLHAARIRDDAAIRDCIGTVEIERAPVQDIADDRAGGAAIADIHRAHEVCGVCPGHRTEIVDRYRLIARGNCYNARSTGITVALLAMSMVTLPDIALADMPIDSAAELVEMLPVTLTSTLRLVKARAERPTSWNAPGLVAMVPVVNNRYVADPGCHHACASDRDCAVCGYSYSTGSVELFAAIPNAFANRLLSVPGIMSKTMPVVDVAMPEELAEMPVPTRWSASPMLASEVRTTGPNVRMPLLEAPAVIVV